MSRRTQIDQSKAFDVLIQSQRTIVAARRKQESAVEILRIQDLNPTEQMAVAYTALCARTEQQGRMQQKAWEWVFHSYQQPNWKARFLVHGASALACLGFAAAAFLLGHEVVTQSHSISHFAQELAHTATSSLPSIDISALDWHNAQINLDAIQLSLKPFQLQVKLADLLNWKEFLAPAITPYRDILADKLVQGIGIAQQLVDSAFRTLLAGSALLTTLVAAPPWKKIHRLSTSGPRPETLARKFMETVVPTQPA